ncbi:MAG TPA: hypothetical protein VEB66_17920 [Opitutaceae bacterium]|nr:hypothetical protein [Opitutaceae bacterium]
MNLAGRPALDRAALAAGTVLVALWLWRCWCIFPLHPWNELRLQPSFLLADGGAVYAGPAGGPATTWIYGPLPVLLFWPATWAGDAASALLAGAALNLLYVVGPLVAFCVAAPGEAGAGQRILAVLAALALWPGSSLHYLQADNLAVSFGLLGMTALLRGGARAGAGWIAAACAVAAFACKQTSLEFAAAQVIWSAWVHGPRAAGRQVLRLAVLGFAGAGAAIAAWGLEPLAFHLVTLPGRLPWAEHPGRQLMAFFPWLLAHVGAPGLVCLVWRRRIWRRDGPLLLPALLWLLSLPAGLAALMKIGGTINSLHGLLYLLPALLVAPPLAAGRRRAAVATFAVLVGATGYRLAAPAVQVWRPLTAHLAQGDFLAREFPGQIWFPWNPLIARYREHRHDHTEDGLVIRQLAARAVPPNQLRRHLPPRWHIVALPSAESNWGLALSLSPAERSPTVVGLWTVHSWPESSPP